MRRATSFEMLALLDVLSLSDQLEPGMIPTVIAGWEFLSIDAYDLMNLRMLVIVRHLINSGLHNLVTRFKDLANVCCQHKLLGK